MADRWPVVASLVPEELWDVGLGNLVIARRMPNGQLACGFFLVDVFCLGVKDVVWKFLAPAQFDATLRQLRTQASLREVTPEYFAKLVYRAVDYARILGCSPHRDFRHAQRLLAGIDPSWCGEEFEFGIGGRPLYMQGLSDSDDEASVISARIGILGGSEGKDMNASATRRAIINVIDELDETKLDEE